MLSPLRYAVPFALCPPVGLRHAPSSSSVTTERPPPSRPPRPSEYHTTLSAYPNNTKNNVFVVVEEYLERIASHAVHALKRVAGYVLGGLSHTAYTVQDIFVVLLVALLPRPRLIARSLSVADNIVAMVTLCAGVPLFLAERSKIEA